VQKAFALKGEYLMKIKKPEMRVPVNIISSLILTVTVLGIYYVSPTWNPLSGKTASEAARYTVWVSHMGCFYLFLQSLQYITGRVGSSGKFWAETLASLLPLLAVVWIVAGQYQSGAEMSTWVKLIIQQTFVFSLCDIIILGGIGALVNRLTDELSKQD
jgi:uncharacterized membrane protein